MPPRTVAAAEDLARHLLASDHERLAHSTAVAAQARVLTAAVRPDQAPLLVAAAWLHDLGYHATLAGTGFHPVDGARHLRRTGWPQAVADLVAHHSGSRFVAHARDLDDAMTPFAFEEDELSDALTVADQTAGPGGRLMSVPERLDDMLARHGEDSPNARAHHDREPYILASAHRVAGRLTAAGVDEARLRVL